MNVDWWCTWHAGPDAGAVHALTRGRHVLGRGADLGALDPDLEPHHALVEVHADGHLALTPLSARTPISVTGQPLDGCSVVADGAWVEVGTSLLTFTRSAPPFPGGAHVHDGVLVRSPRAVSTWAPPEAHQSGHTASPLGTTVTPAVIALFGAAAVALLMRQPMLLAFGAMGALVAIGTWGVQRVGSARSQRRHRRLEQAAIAEFRAHLVQRTITVPQAVHTCRHRGADLWSRRAHHDDAYVVSLGIGSVEVPVHTRPRLEGVPVPITLGPGARIALRGPRAEALARALITQLTASMGPADIRLAVVTQHPTHWNYLQALPHHHSTILDSPRSPTSADEAPHTLFVTDQPDQLTLRTSPLRRALADPTRNALLVVLAHTDAVPHVCTHVCTTTDEPWSWWADARNAHTPGAAQPVRTAALSLTVAQQCAAALLGLRDPEDPASAHDDLPDFVSLDSMLSGSIEEAWAAHIASPNAAPRTPIGVAADGVVDLDLVRDGPHALIAGTTGSGKSELLRTMVLGMAATAPPSHLSFVLIDYKGGATFDSCVELPHVVGIVTDLDEHLADRALRSLHAELRRREGLLRDHAVGDLPSLRAAAPHVLMPRLVVVVDEFAALVAEQSEFLHALIGIAQRGRSLGVHLVLATQRPNGVINDDIRANTNLRLALRLHDSADALDVVGSNEPVGLPRHRPGRAVIRLGPHEHITFHTATANPGNCVRAVQAALHSSGTPVPPAPWQPVLPNVLHAHEVGRHELGRVDNPDQQTTEPLRWSPADGNLVLAGSVGSGTTTALGVVADAVLAAGSHHAYALTDHLAAIGSLPREQCVVVHQRELVARLLHRIQHHSASDPPVVLFIDGLPTVRQTLDDTFGGELDQFDALLQLAGRPTSGLTIVATTDRPGALPAAFLAACPHRWVFHLHDAHEATHLGLSSRAVPPATPGRLRDAATGLLAQVALPGAVSGRAPRDAVPPPPPLTEVPAALDPTALHHVHNPAARQLPLGLDLISGLVRGLVLETGDHCTVLGGGRTGRTTALVRIATAWQQVHPEGIITVIAPRRSREGAADQALRALHHADVTSLSARAAHEPSLVLIDDAELVDDTDGMLAALAAQHDVPTSMVVAGRPEAVRGLYGHFTSVVRRSRLGLVACGGSDLDGDLLGALLPRRTVVHPRPGLMWLVDADGTHLVQIAADHLAPHTSRLAHR